MTVWLGMDGKNHSVNAALLSYNSKKCYSANAKYTFSVSAADYICSVHAVYKTILVQNRNGCKCIQRGPSKKCAQYDSLIYKDSTCLANKPLQTIVLQKCRHYKKEGLINKYMQLYKLYLYLYYMCCSFSTVHKGSVDCTFIIFHLEMFPFFRNISCKVADQRNVPLNYPTQVPHAFLICLKQQPQNAVEFWGLFYYSAVFKLVTVSESKLKSDIE